MNRREFHRLGLMALLARTSLAQAIDSKIFIAASRPRLSIMLWTLGRQLPAEAALDIVDKAGYRAVELLSSYKNWKPDQISAFKAKLKATGIVVDSMVSGGFNIADPEQTSALVESVTASIPFAKDFGCSQLILTPNTSGGQNRIIPGQTPVSKRQVIADALMRISDATSKDNIEVLLEPIDLIERKDSSVTSVVEGFEIVRQVARPNIKVLYDFYHEQRGHGNLIQQLDGNMDLIGLVHVAEVPKRTEPGTGEIDYPVIYRKLAELKYSRTIAMEFMPTGDPVNILRAARLEVKKAFPGA